jgi:hypothetical protein
MTRSSLNAARNARKRDQDAVVHRGRHSGLQLAGIDRQGADVIHSHGPVVVEIALLHASALERNRAVQRSRETEERPALHLRRDRVRIDHFAVRCPINLEGESHRRLQTESSTAEGCARRPLFV